MIDWKPIETCPKNEFEAYLGYDAHAETWDETRQDCLCIITWQVPDEDDDWDAEWAIQPLNSSLDYAIDDRTNVTMWAPLSALLPRNS